MAESLRRNIRWKNSKNAAPIDGRKTIQLKSARGENTAVDPFAKAEPSRRYDDRLKRPILWHFGRLARAGKAA
jgi:hypothetical protein